MTRSVRGGTQIRKDMLGGYVDSWGGFGVGDRRIVKIRLLIVR
jgi:hypothetical protein